MTYPQPSQGKHLKKNQVSIAVGHEAIRLLQDDTVEIANFLKEINAFYKQNDYDKIVDRKKLGVTEHLLQNYVPGLANKSDFKWQLLWPGELKRPLYRLPHPLFDKYRAGFIGNGLWCNHISEIPRHILDDDEIVEELVSLLYEDKNYKQFKELIAKLKNGTQTTATARIPKPSILLDSAETAKKHIEKKNIELFVEQEEARYSLRETRPNQRRFAEQVALRYGVRCAVCDITHRPLLQAAHIRAKADDGSDEPENGLILCATHHLAFDNGLLCIDPESLEVTSTPFMHATHASIAHLSKNPSSEALQYHDEHTCKRVFG